MSLKDSDSRRFIQSTPLSEDFESKYEGKCADCRRVIFVRDLIHKVSEGYSHADCNSIKRPEGRVGFGKRTGPNLVGNRGKWRSKP